EAWRPRQDGCRTHRRHHARPAGRRDHAAPHHRSGRGADNRYRLHSGARRLLAECRLPGARRLGPHPANAPAGAGDRQPGGARRGSLRRPGRQRGRAAHVMTTAAITAQSNRQARPGWGGLRAALVAVLVLGLLAVGFMLARPVKVLPRLGAAPSYTLTDPQGRPLGSDDLRGKVVLYDFVYT